MFEMMAILRICLKNYIIKVIRDWEGGLSEPPTEFLIAQKGANRKVDGTPKILI